MLKPIQPIIKPVSVPATNTTDILQIKPISEENNNSEKKNEIEKENKTEKKKRKIENEESKFPKRVKTNTVIDKTITEIENKETNNEDDSDSDIPDIIG